MARAPAQGLAVVVPVRDEEALVGRCLDSILRASRAAEMAGLARVVVVVLDGCQDGSAVIVTGIIERAAAADAALATAVVRMDASNVGAARAAGCARALVDLEGLDPSSVWMATTDADCEVPADWLTHQLGRYAAGIDAWAGTVTVDDWAGVNRAVESAFVRSYRRLIRGVRHGHLHGANLGFTADAYLRARGFPPLPTGEDRALWGALSRDGLRLDRDATCPVRTSGRRQGRAPQGFAHAIGDTESDGGDDQAV